MNLKQILMLFQGLSIAVTISVSGDHYDIDDSPYSAASESYQHQHSCQDVPCVESVNSKRAYQDTQQQSDEPAVIIVYGLPCRLRWCWRA